MDPETPDEMSGGAEPGLPLAGIRVVEFTHMVMGPTCGLVLADMGAEVIKVEPAPGGDNTRRLTGSGAGFFATYNRNKQSIAVDLKCPEGLALARRLIATADVVVENFRPGAMARAGLDYDTLSAENPRLIYCSLKGFLAGPYEHRAALDEVVQMMGGLAYMTGPPGRPLRAGASVNDIMGGMFGAIGILGAITERHRTGRGQQVKSALFENNAFLVAQHMAQYAVTGRPADPMPNRLAAWAVYDVFSTQDQQQIFLAVVTDTQWRAFCDAFELSHLLSLPELATNAQRVLHRDRYMPDVARVVAGLPKAELMTRFERIGLPFAPIAKPEDLFEDPHLNAEGGMVEVTLPNGKIVKLPGLPLAMADRRFAARLDLPRPGQHGAAIAAALGYTPEEIERLLETRVLAADPSQ